MDDPGAASDSRAATPDSVWLVGLSGSGKSTVGPPVARRLGYAFIDMDRRIEEAEGATVADIFARGGEDGFRRAEARATEELLGLTRIVVATGGGWMDRNDLVRGPAGCVRVWLRVSPVAALERLDDGTEARPLLYGEDREATLTGLLERREAAYAEAEVHVETTGRTPTEVADRVVAELIGSSR
jgi:shikimate kinase